MQVNSFNTQSTVHSASAMSRLKTEAGWLVPSALMRGVGGWVDFNPCRSRVSLETLSISRGHRQLLPPSMRKKLTFQTSIHNPSDVFAEQFDLEEIEKRLPGLVWKRSKAPDERR